MRPLYQVNNKIFVTGGTGFIGSSLVPMLFEKGFEVTALARQGSGNKISAHCTVIQGDALDYGTYRDKLGECETFIHLVGVSNPAPAKKKEFEEIDLASVGEALEAIKGSSIKHFIYLSVANPAPIMKDYIYCRLKGQSLIRDTGINATFLQPWYVLGPGRKWPYILLPFYKILERVPRTAEGAARLGLVTIKNMVYSILFAVRNPANGIRIMRVPQIKKFTD
ncbi:MAG: NAD-dependent epimerase/dehydratase family protein [Ignavibacteria bacterium]